MADNEYKKYTLQARRGIKGEAFFESLVCDYSIPHHIVGPKDLGIDYFCEWVHGDKPTGVLYAVQVKTYSKETANLKYVGIEKDLNGLAKYEIHNSHLNVGRKTLTYWQSLGMPVYIFVVVQTIVDGGKEQLDCYYKRFAPILTGNTIPKYAYYDSFYKVNDVDSFIAFKRPGVGGFARDLFIDHVRWCYSRGSIAYSDPSALGLTSFKADAVFAELLRTYKKQVCAVYDRTKAYLEHLGYR